MIFGMLETIDLRLPGGAKLRFDKDNAYAIGDEDVHVGEHVLLWIKQGRAVRIHENDRKTLGVSSTPGRISGTGLVR
jgi:hypothetical protein